MEDQKLNQEPVAETTSTVGETTSPHVGVETGGRVAVEVSDVVGATGLFDFSKKAESQEEFNEQLAQAFVRFANSPLSIEKARELIANGDDLDFAINARERAIREDAEGKANLG